MTTSPPDGDDPRREPAATPDGGDPPRAPAPDGDDRPREPAPAAEDARPRQRHLIGWLALACGAGSFAGSLASGDSALVLIAALGLAWGITGLVRLSRGRASNPGVVWLGIGLSVATIALSWLYWLPLGQDCLGESASPQRLSECVDERTGLLF